jgi:hypothetical protein
MERLLVLVWEMRKLQEQTLYRSSGVVFFEDVCLSWTMERAV